MTNEIDLINDYAIIPIDIDSIGLYIPDGQAIIEGIELLDLYPQLQRIVNKCKKIDRKPNYCFRVKINENDNVDSIEGINKFSLLANSLTSALRLLKLGGSGCIGTFIRKNYILDPWSERIFDVIKPTELNNDDIPKFICIFEKIIKLNNAKFDLMIYKYLFATSGLLVPLENKFLDLIIILEILYTTNKDRNNIGKIIDLRLKQIFKKNELSIDENITEFYKIRNNIIHEGNSINLDGEKIKSLAEVIRKSLLLYLYNSEQFKQENLLNLICE